MSKKVLINVPDLSIPHGGGVANYYRVLKAMLPDNFCFNTIGTRKSYGRSAIINVFQNLIDYFVFIFKIIPYKIIVVNPSFNKICIFRDSVFILIAKLFGKKIIVFWRGYNHNYFEDVIKKKYKTILKMFFFRVDRTIVLGNKIKEELLHLDCKSPIFIETTIVDEQFIGNRINNSSDKNFNILFLSRIEKTKGIYEAIEIYSEITKKYNNVQFLIAGDGSELNNIKKLVAESNIKNVKFLGFITGKEKQELYNTSDVYLFPSYFEGMPNSVLEAMGMGLPILTTEVGGLPDFFINDKMGYMINLSNIDEYIKKIIFLINNKEKIIEIGQFNMEYAKQNFSASIVKERILNHFYLN